MIIKDFHEQLYSTKLENLTELDNLLLANQNRKHVTYSKEIKIIIKILYQNKTFR